jgi:hypothetical protein
MKPRTITERANRIEQIEKLYRAAGTRITREQAEMLADREAAENAATYLNDCGLGEFLPENAQER